MVKKQLFFKKKFNENEFYLLVLIISFLYLSFECIDFFATEFLNIFKRSEFMWIFITCMILVLSFFLIKLRRRLKNLPEVFFDNTFVEIIKDNRTWVERLTDLKILKLDLDQNLEPHSLFIQTPWGELDLKPTTNWDVFFGLIRTQNKDWSNYENSTNKNPWDEQKYLEFVLRLFSLLGLFLTVFIFEKKILLFGLDLKYLLLFFIGIIPWFLPEIKSTKLLNKLLDSQIVVFQGLLFIPLLIQIVWISFIVPIGTTQENNSQCGINSSYGLCYEVPKDSCLTILASAKQTCYTRHVEKIREKYPMRLPGPVVNKCMEYEFDKIAKFMRKNDPNCKEVFNRIEDYAESNY